MANIIDPSSQINTRTGIVTSAGTLLSNNDNRRGVIIQNLGVNPLFVALGTGASPTVFDFILKGAGANDDGSGGIMSFDVLSYTGIISVAGTGVRCTGSDL